MRTEKDSLGTMEIPDDALYGIHSLRASMNFPCAAPLHELWYRAMGAVKLAYYRVCAEYQAGAKRKFSPEQISSAGVRFFEDSVLDVLACAAGEVMDGKHREYFIVPAISGGAGTSINMNINEIIANRALQLIGEFFGSYGIIDPFEHANMFQSTNDVVPTALKIAVMESLDLLDGSINALRMTVERLEKRHSGDLRPGYTEMQEAVPTSFGRLFSTYSAALSRDWWRLSRCHERLKTVNLGGGALGTGLAVPRYVIFRVCDSLKEITSRPVARAENLADATSNLDVFVETHAVMKALAVTLEKMSADLRLLSSDAGAVNGVEIPAVQAGSSIMPGKVNPVIPEYVISACHRVYANDVMVTSLSGQGCLELNAYIPAIGDAMLESLDLLRGAFSALDDNLLRGMIIDGGAEQARLLRSPSISTVLNPVVGYHRASELAKLMNDEGIDVFTANDRLGLLSREYLAYLLEPANLLRLGYSLSEMLDERSRFDKNGKPS